MNTNLPSHLVFFLLLRLSRFFRLSLHRASLSLGVGSPSFRVLALIPLLVTTGNNTNMPPTGNAPILGADY